MRETEVPVHKGSLGFHMPEDLILDLFDLLGRKAIGIAGVVFSHEFVDLFILAVRNAVEDCRMEKKQDEYDEVECSYKEIQCAIMIKIGRPVE